MMLSMENELMPITQVPLKMRLDDGPIQFEDDWPGTFIRGDSGMAYIQAITLVLQALDNSPSQHPGNSFIFKGQLEGLRDMLLQSNMVWRRDHGEHADNE